VGGGGVIMLLVPLGEHVLFLRLEHGKAAYLLEIAGKTALSGNDTGKRLGHISTLLLEYCPLNKAGMWRGCIFAWPRQA
jgi:hypothetical protein